MLIKSPLISLIITCHNQEVYLIQLIDYLKSQSDLLAYFEIIIIDSSDVQLQDITGVSIYKISNNGPSFARNYGFLKSKGEWLIFCDADDFVNPSIFSFVFEKKKTLSADVYFFPYKRLFDEEITRDNLKKYSTLSRNQSIESLLIKNPIYFLNKFIPVHTIIFKRHLFEKVEFRSQQWYVEDVRFCLELLIKAESKIMFINNEKYLSIHRDFKSKKSLSTSNKLEFWKSVCENYNYYMTNYTLGLLDKISLVKLVAVNYHSVDFEIKKIIDIHNRIIWNYFLGLPYLLKNEFIFLFSLNMISLCRISRFKI